MIQFIYNNLTPLVMKTAKRFPALGKFISVKNMETNGGGPTPNQFILTFEKGVAFQSYESIIAVKKGRFYNEQKVYLGSDWDYSTTTGKYRNIFLGMNKKETVKDESIIYVDKSEF